MSPKDYDRTLLQEGLSRLVSQGGEFEYTVGYEMMGFSKKEAGPYWNKILNDLLAPYSYKAELSAEGPAIDLFEDGLVNSVDVKYKHASVMVFRCSAKP